MNCAQPLASQGREVCEQASSLPLAPSEGRRRDALNLGNLGKGMVGVAGFEPATPASRTQCSTRLSHTPTWRAAYRQAPALSQAPKIPPQKEKGREKRSSKRRCIHPTPALSPPPRRAQTGLAVPAGEWCNGNTAVFGTVILGSSPSSPATSPLPVDIARHVRGRRAGGHGANVRISRRTPLSPALVRRALGIDIRRLA